MKKRKKNLRQILIPSFIITACIPLAIFALISQERLKTSTLENMNNQAEADLQKANQSLNIVTWINTKRYFMLLQQMKNF